MAIELAAEIQKRYGFVRRARGCYLYTEKNVRLTDCFLDGGRALLGWDGGKARTVFKDTLERGANGSYCGGYESRLATAVRHLLPSEYTEIRWYYDAPSAACVSGARNLADGAPGAARDSYNTAFGVSGANSADRSTNSTSESPNAAFCAARESGAAASSANNARFGAVLWRPWLDICATAEPKPTRYPEITITHPGAERPDVIKLVPPFAWATSLTIYAFRAASERTQTTGTQTGAQTQDSSSQSGANAAKLGQAGAQIPRASDTVPAPLLAAYARTFCDLKTALGTYGENDFKQ
ncbi:MAG: hypothetical protein J5647_06835, partial [Spirochaetaceae bacterium]|nr:hypothetical protein [Spirochaetaceae bacterium]